MPEVGDPVRTTNKKVSIGDLLYDGHFYGIVVEEGMLREQEIIYNIVWFDFFLTRHIKDMFCYEQAVIDYKYNFARWSTRMPR